MSDLRDQLRLARKGRGPTTTTHAETLERVGRAIYEGGRRQIHRIGNEKTSGPWEGLCSETRWAWVAAAQAAITELERLGWTPR